MSQISPLTDFSHQLIKPYLPHLLGLFSKTVGYIFRAITFLTIYRKGRNKKGLPDVSKSIDILHRFLCKIMQDLVRHGIVDTTKGHGSVLFANADTSTTILRDMLKITDSSLIFDQCALNIMR